MPCLAQLKIERTTAPLLAPLDLVPDLWVLLGLLYRLPRFALLQPTIRDRIAGALLLQLLCFYSEDLMHATRMDQLM